MIYLTKVETGELIKGYQGHKEEVTTVIYSPNGKWIISASFDLTVRIWEAYGRS